MGKTASDIIAEWVARSYITPAQALSDVAKYTSYIMQAKTAILDYCNLPQNIVDFPDGLFYPWVEIGWKTANNTESVTGSGEVKSISEGDTTINYDVGTTAVSSQVIADYSVTLNRYRRLPQGGRVDELTR